MTFLRDITPAAIFAVLLIAAFSGHALYSEPKQPIEGMMESWPNSSNHRLYADHGLRLIKSDNILVLYFTSEREANSLCEHGAQYFKNRKISQSWKVWAHHGSSGFAWQCAFSSAGAEPAVKVSACPRLREEAARARSGLNVALELARRDEARAAGCW